MLLGLMEPSETCIYRFCWSILVLGIFGYFLMLKEIKRLSPLNFGLNFKQIKSGFCHLNVLVCCCEASKYNQIACFFSNIFKNCVRSNRFMKPNLLRKKLLLQIFLYQKVKKNQVMTKVPSSGAPRRVLTCLLPLVSETLIYAFL